VKLQWQKLWDENTARQWRPFFFALGLLLVLVFWFGTRVYLVYNFQPMHHAMTKVFKDMSVSVDEGRPFGEINLGRVARNLDFSPKEVYKPAAEPGDHYCQFKTLDPGLGIIYMAANKILFFIPDTEMRIVCVQLLLDGLLVAFLYLTFYRWGWLPAVFAGVLYSSHSVFALSADTAWYHFWDGMVATWSMLLLLWIYRLAKAPEKMPRVIIVLAILLGLILSAGVWIRSGWFIFAPVLLGFCLFFKTLRPWIKYAFVVYMIFAAGMVWRASELSGHLTYSTRMSWHTAFQALGRYPNSYGLEDDDLYLFERSHREDGVNYNLCDYSREDQAMKQKFMALWHNNPGYIVHSVAQRMFSSIFGNFSDQGFQFWDHDILFAAWLGLMLGLWLGGEFQFFTLAAALMYLAINAAYSLVYYIHHEYSYPTQMMNIFGAIVATTGLCELVRRIIARDWPRMDKDKIHPVTIGLLISALVAVILFLPPAQKYFSPNPIITYRWDTPPGMMASDYTQMLARMHALPVATRRHLIQFLKSHTSKKVPGPNEPLFQYAVGHLRKGNFTNLDGHTGEFWYSQKINVDTYEALARSAKSISGLGYDWISGFEIDRPGTWDGKELRFQLLPNLQLLSENVDRLLIDKFAIWGWTLQPLGGGKYLAIHTRDGCSDMRMQLAKYFNHQCGELTSDEYQ